MIARFEIDPSTHECGAATKSVRALLEEYGAIDWFEPPTIDLDEVNLRFSAYHRCAHAAAPSLFERDPMIDFVAGDGDDFVALCDRAREGNHGWDWKFSGLKPLGSEHARTHDWDRAAVVYPSLMMSFGEGTVWTLRMPELSLVHLPKRIADAAGFYHSYADIDTYSAVEWQLAEPTCALDDNPFVLLSRVYAGGYYPFHFGRDRVELFCFA